MKSLPGVISSSLSGSDVGCNISVDCHISDTPTVDSNDASPMILNNRSDNIVVRVDIPVVAVDGKSSASTRWIPHSLFLRLLYQRSLLTLNVRSNPVMHGGEKFGDLDTSVSCLSLSIIAKDWGAWLIALRFVPLSPTWIWIFDSTWQNLLHRLFPTTTFLDGFHSSLPPDTILLLSKITLTTSNITLHSCLVSLILSTFRLCVSSGWQYNYWLTTHAEVGSYTNGSWVLHSASRWDLVVLPAFSSHFIIPPGNVRRVVCSTVYSDKPSLPPSSSDTLLVGTLFPLVVLPPSFLSYLRSSPSPGGISDVYLRINCFFFGIIPLYFFANLKVKIVNGCYLGRVRLLVSWVTCYGGF